MEENIFTSYKDEINNRIDDVYQRGIALKIAEHMDRIRNGYSIDLARRWPLELLQNAVDACSGNRKVKVRVVVSPESVKFMHNGDPFRLNHILSLINQVSSKKRDNTEAIGRFGTGFMTTFQLSEKVEIEGIMQDGGLPAKKFHVMLDRTGRGFEEITAGIATSMEQLMKADDESDCEYVPEEFNTCFTYRLENDQSIKCAGIGANDLRKTAVPILLFSDGIDSIEVVDEMNETPVKVTFVRETMQAEDNDEQENETYHVTVLQQDESDSQRSTKYEYLFKKGSNVTIALPEDREQNRILPIPESMPRLYIEFPLIGSERFPFPTMINSRSFNPNEPRSGITLIDNSYSLDAVENRQLMKEAESLYEELLKELAGQGKKGLENAVYVPEWKEDEQMPASYVEELLLRLYNEIAKLPLIQTQEGFATLNNSALHLVDGDSDEEVRRVRAIQRRVKGLLVEEDGTNWCKALERYPLRNGLVTDLYQITVHAKSLLKRGLTEDTTIPKWLAELERIVWDNESLKSRLCAGEFNIYLNRKNAERMTNEYPYCGMQLYNYFELYRDDSGDEEILRISDEFSGYYRNVYGKANLFAKEYSMKDRNCRSVTMVDFAQGISRCIDTLLKKSSLGEADEWAQDLCASLLAWIFEHKQRAEIFFPGYSTDIGRAKLMSPGATAKLWKERSQLESKCSTLEEQNNSLAEEVKQLKTMVKRGGFSDSDEWYDSELDVEICFDDLQYFEDGDRDELSRIVGEGGEQYAMKHLQERYEQKGYFVCGTPSYEYGGIVELCEEDSFDPVIRIERADLAFRKQEGYDIRIVENVGTSEQTERFVEVKTHTMGSTHRDTLRLSNSQMAMAMKLQGNYEVLHVIWDVSQNCGIEAKSYENPMAQIAEKRLLNSYPDYRFVVQ